MKYGYYPGCSLEGTSAEYDRSVRNSARALGIELVEVPDWNCCGASSAHMTNRRLAFELGRRNLQLAERIGEDLLAPCAACFNRLKTAHHQMKNGDHGLGLSPEPVGIEVIRISDVLNRSEVVEKLAEVRSADLGRMPLAAYYGCLTSRPPEITGEADYENPQGLDRIIKLLGGRPVAWSHKTECCSGGLAMTRPDIGRTLVERILAAAKAAGARAIVVDCPLCQANLDSRQSDLAKQGKNYGLPIMFVTELIEMCTGESAGRRQFKEHLIDPGPLFAGAGS